MPLPPIRRSRSPGRRAAGRRRMRSAVPPVRPPPSTPPPAARPGRRKSPRTPRRPVRSPTRTPARRAPALGPSLAASSSFRLPLAPGLSGRFLALLRRHQLAVHAVEASPGPEEQRDEEEPWRGAELPVEPVSQVHEDEDGEGELQPDSGELGGRRAVLHPLSTGRTGGQSSTRRLTHRGGI